ncbi:hypothetical protein [Mesorhizobium sp. 131-2-1]|uniref:hypothetical protein n=1 Tax=Mesorhizobium sp. 131-2-1 TaxID=2744518 RepID=UPI0019256AB0|nr:hypothetical protein [Mesorhizobium sp. 131-2-1]
MKFAKMLQKQMQAKQKGKLSPVAIKKVLKTVQGLGLTVRGVKARPDGSFFVETGKGDVQKAHENEWDEVLEQ